MVTQNFFGDVFSEFARLSRAGWLLVLLVGVITSITEFAHWRLGPNLTTADYIGLAFTVPAWFVAAYVASMSMVSRQPNATSLFRFVTVIAVLGLPIVIGIAGILLLLPSPHKDAILSVTLSLLFAGWILLTMLPALPVAQALSTSFVSPVKVFRGTKGHRWSLFLISFATGSINKIVPEPS